MALGSCADIAHEPDCRMNALRGNCAMVLGNKLTIGYYCAKSCGLCKTSSCLTCSNLVYGCNSGSCLPAVYFSQSSIQCICPIGRGGTYCQQGKNFLTLHNMHFYREILIFI